MAKQHRMIDYQSTLQAQSPKEASPAKWLIELDLLLFLLGCFLSCGSIFAFDAPGSDKQPATWMLVVTSLALPVTSLVSLLVGTILLKCGNYKAARLVLLLPLLNLLLFALAVVWIEVFHGGRLDG